MREDYTILIPNMSPIHFDLMIEAVKLNGYKVLLLNNSGPQVIQEGLKYVHNDMCYPALLVIGQMIDFIKSGKIDVDKCAVAISQTGGGCRASNYYYLLKKALERAGYPQIPVISLNLKGMNSNPGLKLTPKLLLQVISGLIYGDLLMVLSHQVRPYEINKGDTDAVVKKWSDHLKECYRANKGFFWSYLDRNLAQISDDLAAIPVDRKTKHVKVGVVGEIYMKYAPLGNNNLEKFLEDEGCEVMMPPLFGFVLYGVSNGIRDYEFYGGRLRHEYHFVATKLIMPLLKRFEKKIEKAIRRHPEFAVPASIDELEEMGKTIIHTGCKMGEGWLLTAEMLELIKKGYGNIVCTQPFGCLPNHIVAKGMVRPIKELYPDSNIVPIDYDPSATRVNQENRIKLMLAVAKENLEKEKK
ncbi:MAG: 2-hydroxyacyl-CoA dehydratase [Spirochaetales bacterium]|nr:2-hydroxyacyl-CoA dehydratase [Spirochaetales bacterium]